MRVLVFVAFIAVTSAGCGSTALLESSRPGEEISVDAQLLEWGAKLQDVAGSDLSVGVQNDDEYLYVSLSTRDVRTIGLIMQAGMVLWVDPAGGKERTFGVRYPLGLNTDSEFDRGLGEGLAANRVRIERSMQELELIGANGQVVRRRKDSVPGIAAEVEADRRVLTYEIQLPLASSEGVAYSIGAKPGLQIGIGFTTPELDREGIGEQGGAGGLPGGRMTSADGRNPYMGPGTPQGSAYQMSMDTWMVVSLASSD